MSAGVLAMVAVLLVGAIVAPVVTRSVDRRAPRGDHATGDETSWNARLQRFVVRLGTVRRFRGRDMSTPDAVAAWCDALARSVRSGTTLRDAVSTVRPDDRIVGAAVDQMCAGLRRGRTLADVLRVRPTADRHLDAACDVIAVSAELGGSSAAPLDRLAAALRRRAADERERVAQAAQARMSAKVLTVVPLAVLGLLAGTDPDVRRVITTPVGGACVASGLALNLVGNRWMRRLIGSGR